MGRRGAARCGLRRRRRAAALAAPAGLGSGGDGVKGGRRRLIREGAGGVGEGARRRRRAPGGLGRGGGCVRVREMREVGRPARLGLGPVGRGALFFLNHSAEKFIEK